MEDNDPYPKEIIVKGFRKLEGRELDLAYIIAKATLEMISEGKDLSWMEKKAMLLMKIIDEIRNERLMGT